MHNAPPWKRIGLSVFCFTLLSRLVATRHTDFGFYFLIAPIRDSLSHVSIIVDEWEDVYVDNLRCNVDMYHIPVALHMYELSYCLFACLSGILLPHALAMHFPITLAYWWFKFFFFGGLVVF